MAFVDTLRQGPKDRAREQDLYRVGVMAEMMQQNVRGWCEDRWTQHKAEGYLLEVDNHGIDRTFPVKDLYRPVQNGAVLHNASRRAIDIYRGSFERSALVGSPLCHKRFKMSVLTEKEGVQYAAEKLKQLLIEDGFSHVSVQVVSLPDVYDEIRETGFFNVDVYLDRKKSSQIVGYTIKFHVEW